MNSVSSKHASGWNERSVIGFTPMQTSRHTLYSQKRHHVVRYPPPPRHKKKMKTQNSSEEANLNYCIPELKKVCNPHSSPFKRMFWILAVLSCGAICIYQFQDSVRLYLSNPVTTDVSFVRRQTLDFPAITICPSKEPALSYISKFMKNFTMQNGRRFYRNPRLPREDTNITFKQLNKSLQEVWDDSAMTTTAINVSIPCISLEGYVEDCYDEMTPYKMNVMSIQTFLGKCTILTPSKPANKRVKNAMNTKTIEYQGPNTYLYFRIDDLHSLRTYNNFQTDVQIFVHVPELLLIHDAVFMAEFMYRDYKTNIRFSISEFTFLNRSQKSCSSAVTNNFCRNNCIEEQLESLMPCKLPFMNHRRRMKECKTVEEAIKAYDKAHAFYVNMKTKECRCQQNCNDTVYHMSVDVEGEIKGNKTEFMLYYADNLLEELKETYAYGFSALISDIGGSLGFFLGVCCLSCIEIIEKLFEKVFSTLCKCHKRSTRPHNGSQEYVAPVHSYFYEEP